ncbi:Trafficking protein particle complex subunit 5 [Trichoplax sp. H2]|nr:Trafficking protein particle complex subunit 5 [Trichoplax sp. H2]|eukprot:RDD47813.1 Trafficking protein particle complex subunit 5 [Trichoplax sp. H2]
MESKSASIQRKSTNILEKPLSKGRGEINLSTFAFLFSELVQYCQNRSSSVVDLQQKLASLGHHVGTRILDALYLRERGSKRELRLLQALIFVKTTVWKSCFGREADKLELSNDDEKTCIF